MTIPEKVKELADLATSLGPDKALLSWTFQVPPDDMMLVPCERAFLTALHNKAGAPVIRWIPVGYICTAKDHGKLVAHSGMVRINEGPRASLLLPTTLLKEGETCDPAGMLKNLRIGKKADEIRESRARDCSYIENVHALFTKGRVEPGGLEMPRLAISVKRVDQLRLRLREQTYKYVIDVFGWDPQKSMESNLDELGTRVSQRNGQYRVADFDHFYGQGGRLMLGHEVCGRVFESDYPTEYKDHNIEVIL